MCVSFKLGDEIAHPQVEVRVCPYCGSFLKKKDGRFGQFWGRSGYPECRYTERYN